MTTEKKSISFQEVLNQAVKEPGRIMQAYRAFHGYSLGNQLLAMGQCLARDIPIGPISTFKGWMDKGRCVKKGEKAIQLCVPVPCKVSKESKNDKGETETKEAHFTRFTYRNNWFVLSQTEGADLSDIPAVAEWNQEQALKNLDIKLVPFAHPNGNVQGYASGDSVAVNPLAQLPLKTLFHEMGHVVLGHTGEHADDDKTPKNIKEVEAESVALLCLSALNLPGAEFCRGYIQGWLDGNEIPEKSAQKIMHAADKILKAGTESKNEGKAA